MSQMTQNQPVPPPNSGSEESGRIRSGSFSSQDARRSGPVSSSRPDASKSVQDETRIMFHRELMETCADLMSRYTYGNSAPYAQQSETVGKILKVCIFVSSCIHY